jgi:hypothetical protein
MLAILLLMPENALFWLSTYVCKEDVEKEIPLEVSFCFLLKTL